MIEIKNVSFQIDEEFHKQLKIQATKEGKGIKEYIIELVKKDLEEKKKQGNEVSEQDQQESNK